LAEKIGEHSDKITADFIKETHKLVDATQGNALSTTGPPPERTLWHVLYFPERQAMQVSYYLHDEADPEHSGKAKIVRSDYLDFQLPVGGVSSR
jgi:hypothetical protein